MQYKLNRDVTKDECSWLDRDYKKGEKVYAYDENTYGCVSSTGVACTEQDGVIPFMEFPAEALDKVTH